MSRTIYPSIRSDTAYTMQQPAAQVSRADGVLPPPADSRPQDHGKPTIEMSECSPPLLPSSP